MSEAIKYFVSRVRRFIISSAFVYYSGVQVKIEEFLKFLETVLAKRAMGKSGGGGVVRRIALSDEELGNMLKINHYIKHARLSLVGTLHDTILAKDIENVIEKILSVDIV